MNVKLAYGSGHLAIDLPDDRTTVIEPSPQPGLVDECSTVLQALRRPIGAAPLVDWIKPASRVCIVFTDITRATPNHRLIPWLLTFLEEEAGVRPGQITLLNSTGTHRPNTTAELTELLTMDVVRRYRVINHECEDARSLIQVGTTSDGAPALLNRNLIEADVRIVTGFIEPHFFAGFSGGPKGIMPGCAGMKTVLSNHGPRQIGDPNAAFGITRGNPIWEEMRDIALRVGPSFLLNVTLNDRKEITGVFAGDLLEAHRQGAEFVRHSAMQRVQAPFDIVITTNSGYPLDMNLYQGVKGMSAGVRILREGGLLVLACECREGVPAGSPMDQIHRSAENLEEILATLMAPGGTARPEQWQAQIQALLQRRADVRVYSSLPDDVVRACHLTPCHDIAATVAQRQAELGPKARVAVLPQGPLTIPYLG